MDGRGRPGIHHVHAGDYAPAPQPFLEIMKRGRGFEGDPGRKRVVEVYGLRGDDHSPARNRCGCVAGISC